MRAAVDLSDGRPVLIDKYMEGNEIEVDAILRRRAGADSGHHGAHRACRRPLRRLDGGLSWAESIEREVDTLMSSTPSGSRWRSAPVGLLNIQYVSGQDPARPDEPKLYVIEVNPRGSRTVPFLSKVTGVPMVEPAVNVMLGRHWEIRAIPAGSPVAEPGGDEGARLLDVETCGGRYLSRPGNEIHRRGDGNRTRFQVGACQSIDQCGPETPSGRHRASVDRASKIRGDSSCTRVGEAGYTFYATQGTAEFIRLLGHDVLDIHKRLEGKPDILDIISGARSTVSSTFLPASSPKR